MELPSAQYVKNTMRPNGTDKKRYRAKYIFPMTKYAERLCMCLNPCTKSNYGRVVNISLKDDPRLFCDPPQEFASMEGVLQ